MRKGQKLPQGPAETGAELQIVCLTLLYPPGPISSRDLKPSAVFRAFGEMPPYSARRERGFRAPAAQHSRGTVGVRACNFLPRRSGWSERRPLRAYCEARAHLASGEIGAARPV